jgi:hypothetical protein
MTTAPFLNEGQAQSLRLGALLANGELFRRLKNFVQKTAREKIRCSRQKRMACFSLFASSESKVVLT